MSKTFRNKDRKAATKVVAKGASVSHGLALPQPDPTLDPSADPTTQDGAGRLSQFLNSWTRGLFAKPARRSKHVLRKKRSGIDALEPRVLLSGDPISAAMSFAAGNSDATLRVVEVEYNRGTADAPDTQKEHRLQLIQGVSATGSNVIAERRIVEIDGQKRVVTGDWDETSTLIDVLNITGSSGNNRLVIDQSVLSLHEGVQFDVSMQGGSDQIIGPSVSEGLVWSLDSSDGTGFSGELAMLAPTGDMNNPSAGDRTLDSRVTYEGGSRDQFLSFSGVTSIDGNSSRDVLADRTTGANEWALTWDASETTLTRSGITFQGAEGLKGQTHLNLSSEARSASQTGADINAESGELRLYEAGDSSRQSPLMLDTRGISAFTGTDGMDLARAAQGVDFTLRGGYDVAYGTDDLLQWDVTSFSATGNAEAAITLDFFEYTTNPATPADANTWVDLTQTAQLSGVDEIRGGDADDRLILSDTNAMAVLIKGDEENATLDIARVSGGTSVLVADDIEYLTATVAGSILDYSTLAYDVSVDFQQGSASAFVGIAGFTGVKTGSGEDDIIAAADTTLIETGAGADTITLTRFTGAVSVDAGAGADVLKGDLDARSDSYTYVDDDDPTTPEPIYDANGVEITRDPVTNLPVGSWQVTDPLNSRFEVTNLDSNGADGTFSTVLDGTTAQGATASFANVETIEGQGASGDEDILVMNIGAGADPITWQVVSVYEGAVLMGSGALAYTNVARGQNSGSRHLTLAYSDASGAFSEYDGDVIVDLMTGYASGFESFTGNVNTLLGTSKNDSLLGNLATTRIEALAGDDLLGLEALDGAVAIGGTGTNTLGYRSAAGTVTLTNANLSQSNSTANGVATISDISRAVILATGDTAGVTINASVFSGSTVLQGGSGADVFSSGLGAENGFLSSDGSDSLTNNGSAGAYYLAEEASGNWTVGDSGEPPPVNWSAAMFRKRRTTHGKQATEAGRDSFEVTAS